MSYLWPHCNSFQMEDFVWWFGGEKAHQLVVRDLWREIQLDATKQALGGANRRSANQAKVFRAHAVPQEWHEETRVLFIEQFKGTQYMVNFQYHKDFSTVPNT